MDVLAGMAYNRQLCLPPTTRSTLRFRQYKTYQVEEELEREDALAKKDPWKVGLRRKPLYKSRR